MAASPLQDEIEPEVLSEELRFHLKYLMPSGTLRASEMQPTAEGKNIICVVSLFGWTTKNYILEAKAKASELIDLVYSDMKLTDSVEKDYFSVFFYDRNHKVFVDPLKSLKDQKVPKLAKGKNPTYSLHFGVKFYLAQPRIMDQYARYLYSLQLCEDIKANRVSVDFEMATKLTALLVQVAVGDYDETRHTAGYTKPLERLCLVPATYRPTNYEVNLMEEHKKLRGLPRSRAEFQFTERARQLPCYGCHLFAAQDENNNAVLVGNSYRGISVFKEGTEVNFFRWLNMTKIQYKGKHFFIKYHPVEEEAGGRKADETVYKVVCDNRFSAKRLWMNAIEQHTFFKRNKPDELTRIGSFIKRGSGFRYSGVTLRQIRSKQQDRPKSQPMLATQLQVEVGPTSRADDAITGMEASVEINKFLQREHKVMQRAFPEEGGTQGNRVEQEAAKTSDSMLETTRKEPVTMEKDANSSALTIGSYETESLLPRSASPATRSSEEPVPTSRF